MQEYYGRRAFDKATEVQRDLRRLDEAQRVNHATLTAAFNRVAGALEALTDEVRQLRADLNPKELDKPRMPRPEGG